MKLAFVSHCNFEGNSAMHVWSIATELTTRGHECVMLVPNRPETVESHGRPVFRVMDYPQARQRGLGFAGDVAPDLIVAWTPRNHVKEITEHLVRSYGSPYVVHMEDNEEQIVRDELNELTYEELRNLPEALVEKLLVPWRSHPRAAERFMAGGVGYTCLIEKLLDYKPDAIPGLVFWPGHDAVFSVETTDAERLATREEIGVAPDEIMLLYSGNVHFSIADDIARLYAAVVLLRRQGRKVRLVRTGWNHPSIPVLEDPELEAAAIELGFVDREMVPRLVKGSDLLVQPGRSDLFNDYRFPSKLPEYLISGRPVVLPDSNIGTYLNDRHHVLKLRDGSLSELVGKIATLIDDPDLRASLGRNGRAFAAAKLTWPTAVNRIEPFLERLVAAHKPVPVHGPNGDGEPRDAPKGGEEASAREDNKYPIKVIAHYLPQFHPIPENDKWWGKGFTEWTNVARAKPWFRGHPQPRFPTELGYYDLRVTETMREQAELAKEYGVHGFCFYYYWFSGRRLLERPLDLWLADPSLDLPFCLSWANEPWSRRWDGSEEDVLMPQYYRDEDTDNFFYDVLPFLQDPRYIKVAGEPLLIVYRITEMPRSSRMIARWKELAREAGFPGLHVACTQSFGISDPRPYGADSAVEFLPAHVDRMLLDPARVHGVSSEFAGYLEDYISCAMRAINAEPKDYVQYRGCFPMWDNTARRQQRGHVFINESTKAYSYWLRYLVQETMIRRDQQEPLIFVNAWNEWAEGTYLEPDQRHGRSLLEVSKAAIEQGILDCELGYDPDREQAFTEFVSRVPEP